MFTIDTDKTISITRGDSGYFVAPIDYAFAPTDVLRLKVFRKKACEDVVLQKDFFLTGEDEAVTIEGKTISLFLTEQDTRFGEIISKPVTYWYEIELNPDNNPQTLVGYDEDGPKIFMLYPEGRDLEDDELTEEEIETFRKLLEEFREDIPKETQKYLDEHIDSIAAEVEKNPITTTRIADDAVTVNKVNQSFISEILRFMDTEEIKIVGVQMPPSKKLVVTARLQNKLTEYKEGATDTEIYSAKVVNDIVNSLKTELQGDIEDISALVGGAE